MNIKENIAYAASSKAKVSELLALMKLEKLLHYPKHLSGGQAQE